MIILIVEKSTVYNEYVGYILEIVDLERYIDKEEKETEEGEEEGCIEDGAIDRIESVELEEDEEIDSLLDVEHILPY